MSSYGNNGIYDDSYDKNNDHDDNNNSGNSSNIRKQK